MSAQIPISKEHIFSASTFILPALLAVTIQFLVIPMTEVALGQTPGREALILVVFLTGLAVGQAQLIPIRHIAPVLIVIGLVEIGIGLFYGNILLAAAADPTLKVLLTAYLFIVTFVGGYLLISAMYENATRVHTNYLLINVFSLILVLTLIGTFTFAGLHTLHLIVGAVLIGLQYTRNDAHPTPRPPIRLGDGSMTSILLGFASGLFVSIFFTLLYLGFYPNGLTYPLYLSLTFVMLATAGLLEIRFRYLSRHIHAGHILSAASITSVLVILFLFGGMGTSFFFDSLQTLSSLPEPRSLYWAFALVLTSLLFLPYLFFSFSVPLQERNVPGYNHLFFVTLGNIIGILLFSILLAEMALSWKIMILLILPLLPVLYMGTHPEKLIITCLVAVSLFSFMLLTDMKVEERVISQNRRMQDMLWSSTPDLSGPHQVRDFELFHISGQERATLFNIDPNTKNLGLGGYFSWLFSRHDLLQAQVAREVIDAKRPPIERVLVLGLGNHLVLEHVRMALAQNGDEYRIDVIDNFGPFKDPQFRSRIGSENGFDWNTASNTYFFSDDAFQQLAQNDTPYDLIVWNLAWPNYGTAGPLFTAEFFERISKNLAPSGLFLTNYFQNTQVDCLTAKTFDHVAAYPRTASYYVSVLVAESKGSTTLNTILNGTQGVYLNPETHCRDTQIPTLARPFQMPLENYGIIHQDTPSAEKAFVTEPARTLKTAHGISLLSPNMKSGYAQTVVIQPTDEADTPRFEQILSGIRQYYRTGDTQNSHLLHIPGTAEDIVNLKHFLSLQDYAASFVTPLITDWNAVHSHTDFETLSRQRIEHYSISPLPLSTKTTRAIDAYTLWPDFTAFIDTYTRGDHVIVLKKADHTWWNEWTRDAMGDKRFIFESIDNVQRIIDTTPENISDVVVLGGTQADLRSLAEIRTISRGTRTWIPDFDARPWNTIPTARSQGWKVAPIWSPQQNTKACSFATAYYAQHGMYPSPAVAYGYTTAQILDQTATSTPAMGSGQPILQNSPIGDISFNASGQRNVQETRSSAINCVLEKNPS